MQNFPGPALLALVVGVLTTAGVDAATEQGFTNPTALGPESRETLTLQQGPGTALPGPAMTVEGATAPGRAAVVVAQASGQAEGLQQKLDVNPFLKRFQVNLTALDVTDGFATIEVTEGPQAVVDQVAAGVDVADIDLESLPSNKDRRAVVAMRKVLESLMEQESLAAILLVVPPAYAKQETVAATEQAAAPAADDEQPEQPAAAIVAAASPAQASAPVLDEKTLVMNIQQRLNELGYDAGPADGIPGRGTRAAIREYQGVSGIAVDGEASTDLLAHMNSAAAAPRPADLPRSTPARRSPGKPVVGVAEFTNTATGTYWWTGGVGWELSGMLANELANTGDFRVVERSKLEPVLAEQDLAASGRIAKGTGARIGMVTGAEYLVLGTVTAFESNTASTGGGISFGGVSIGGKKKEAYIAVDVRVVNSNTGELDFVRTVEGRSKGTGISLGLFRGGFGGALASEKNTPAGKAIRAVIVEITDFLSCAMVEQGDCMAEYDAKERKRREKLKSGVTLD